MSLNLESYILLNLFMNLAVLALCARVKGHVNWTQLLFAAGFGTLYAVATVSYTHLIKCARRDAKLRPGITR